MGKMIQERVTTQGDSMEVVKTGSATKATTAQTVEYLIYYFFGFVEVLLLFRFLLMLSGANRTSGFVAGIYGFTRIFVLPFEGIFRASVSQGAEMASVFEPATLVAIIVYPLLAFGIVTLLRVLNGEKEM